MWIDQTERSAACGITVYAYIAPQRKWHSHSKELEHSLTQARGLQGGR